MLSLYIHIPFCHKKCGYCSFPVIPIEKLQQPAWMAEQYISALFADIEFWSKKISGENTTWEGNTMQELSSVSIKPQLKTIYFWWGTPLLLWAEYLLRIMEQVEEYFDCSQLEELSIECNPYPYSQTLESVQKIAQAYRHIPRVRFSFGIQSLDDTTLTLSNRENNFAGIVQFTKDLLALKQPHILYNYDFIAFGTQTNSEAMSWLQELLTSHAIDSYSLYTLELFAGAKRYHETKDPLIAYQAPRDHNMPFTTSEDTIFDEFSLLKKMLIDAWYNRYEISNYALPGKESIHNQTYRTMTEYLGVWLGAHSLLATSISDNTSHQEIQSSKTLMQRWAIASWWKKYIDTENRGELMSMTPLTIDDVSIETVFLWLRQRIGLKDLSSYSNYLIDGRQSRVQKLVEEGLAIYQDDRLILTDTGMNLHHRVCTYLLKDI